MGGQDNTHIDRKAAGPLIYDFGPGGFSAPLARCVHLQQTNTGESPVSFPLSLHAFLKRSSSCVRARLCYNVVSPLLKLVSVCPEHCLTDTSARCRACKASARLFVWPRGREYDSIVFIYLFVYALTKNGLPASNVETLWKDIQ